MADYRKAGIERGGAFLNEFRAFVSRGNVIDLAVGIIIGAAFTSIVSSLVKDIIMPPIGLATGGVDFSNIFITLSGGDYATLAEAQAAGAATLNVGLFLNACVNFLIVAFAIFILVKQLSRFQRKEEIKDVAKEAAAPPPRQEVLLEEIRDLLKHRIGP
jgi:large conductance mechanosensitive channel